MDYSKLRLIESLLMLDSFPFNFIFIKAIKRIN